MPIYPPLPVPPISIEPALIPNTGFQEVFRLAPSLYRDQIVLVPGVQGPGLVLPSKTLQGTRFAPEATPGAGQFSLTKFPFI